MAALVHIILEHPDKRSTCARALFSDFSSAFNVIKNKDFGVKNGSTGTKSPFDSLLYFFFPRQKSPDS